MFPRAAAGAHEGLQSAISDGAPDMGHFPQEDPDPAIAGLDPADGPTPPSD